MARRQVRGAGDGDPELISSRARSAVFRGRVHADGRPAIVKVRQSDVAVDAPDEPRAYRALRSLRDVIGLPDLIAVGADDGLFFTVLGDVGLPNLATAREAFDGATLTAAVESAAARLRTIHEAPVPGELLSSARWAGVTGWHQRLGAAIAADLRTVEAMDPPGGGDLARRVADLITAPPTWEGPLAILHGDYGAPNVLVDPRTGRVRIVIDWEWARVGDPAFDLAKVRLEALAATPSRLVDEHDLSRFVVAYGAGSEALDRWDDSVLGLAHVLPLLVALLRSLPADHHAGAVAVASTLVEALRTGST